MDCSRKVIRNYKRLDENKYQLEWRTASWEKLKMRNSDWLKGIVKHSIGTGSTANWNGLSEYEKSDIGTETQRDFLRMEILRHFLFIDKRTQHLFPDSVRQKNVHLGRVDEPMINNQRYPVTNTVCDEIMPITCCRQQNEFLIEKGMETLKDRIWENSAIANTKEPTQQNDCAATPPFLLVTVGKEKSNCNEPNAMQKSKDIKIAELLGQLRLAQYTITQQQSLILDLEKKILDIAENLSDQSSQVNTTCSLSEMNNDEVIEAIHFKIGLLKKYECMLGDLKLSEINLTMALEEARKEKYRLEDSVHILYEVIDQLQESNFISKSEIRDSSNTDVLILHDNLLTHIKTDLFEKQRLKMENILCLTLSDALTQLQTYEGIPKVVIVHTGTSDLLLLDVEDMCSILSDIHAFATNNGIKLIICSLTPNDDGVDIAKKVHVFNSAVYARFNPYDNITICKSNDINDHAKHPQGKNNKYNKNKENIMTLRRHNRISFSPYRATGKENYDADRESVTRSRDLL